MKTTETAAQDRTLYQCLLDAGIPESYIDHHESDLYVLCTPQTKNIIESFYKGKGWDFNLFVKLFNSLTPPYGEWYDCAFAYDPYWEELNHKLQRRLRND